MRAGIVVTVTRADRRRLEAIVADRGAPQKHVWRANIILATADGYGTAEIMRRLNELIGAPVGIKLRTHILLKSQSNSKRVHSGPSATFAWLG
jgi:ATP-dependent protease HslVU (ClpYQ) ATPase subunit